MYVERQEGRWCGVHATNAFLGSRVIERRDIQRFQWARADAELARINARRASRPRRPSPLTDSDVHDSLRRMGDDGGMDGWLLRDFLIARGGPRLVQLRPLPRGSTREAIKALLGDAATGAVIHDTDARPYPHSYAIRRLREFPEYWAFLDSYPPSQGLLLGSDARWEDMAGRVWVLEHEADPRTVRAVAPADHVQLEPDSP
jgi:hypothetical protein